MPAAEPEPAPVLPHMGVRAPLPVSFSNPIALRVAFLMSLITMLLTVIPILLPVWWLLAGSCAVLLYRRLTGMQLTVRAGARLGSITGILAFLGFIVASAITLAFVGNQFFNELSQEMVKRNPAAAQLFNDPAVLVFATIVWLIILFAMVVGMCAAGGALGARFANRNAKV